MARARLTTWSTGMRKPFRLFEDDGTVDSRLQAALSVEDGAHWQKIHQQIPFDVARSGDAAVEDDEDQDDEDAEEGDEAEGTRLADPTRYRHLKQILVTIGLMWQERRGNVHFTDFGRTLKRYLPLMNRKNLRLLVPHAALALSVCQLRNPTKTGRGYDGSMEVFPYRFLWQAMLELGGRINSEELNRVVLRIRNETMLLEGIARIADCRRRDAPATELGEPVVTEAAWRDRIIPIVSIASFGWALIRQKEDDPAGFFTLREEFVPFLQAATYVPVAHREFGTSVEAYVTRISNAACLPKDLR